MSNTEELLQTGSRSDFVDYGVIPHPAPRSDWPILAVLIGIQFIHILDFTMMMPLGPQFMRLFDISPQQFGFLISVYTFSAGIFVFITAFMVDHFDRKVTVILVCAGFSVATLFCALATDYESLLIARVIAGAFGGVMSAVVFSIISDIIPEHRRGAATGAVMSSFPLVSVVGVPMSLFLVELIDWRTPFFLLTVLGLMMIIAVSRVLPPIRDHLRHHREKNPLRQFYKIFSNSNHLVAFALIALLMFAGFTVIPFISIYMVANGSIKEVELPYLYFFGGLFAFFTAHLFGQLADRYGKPRLFNILAMLSLVPIILVTHLSDLSLVSALLVTTLFMILVAGRFIPMMAMITASVLPQLRGSFMNFNASVQQISAGAASLVAGSMIGISSDGEITNFETVGIVAVAATIGCVLLSTKLRVVEENIPK